MVRIIADKVTKEFIRVNYGVINRIAVSVLLGNMITSYDFGKLIKVNGQTICGMRLGQKQI